MRRLRIHDKNQILALVLIVQLALVAVVFWPSSPSVAAGEPLLPGLEADQVVRVTIRDGSGENIELAKNGDVWVLPEAGDYPCKEDAVAKLVEQLSGLKTGRLVTQTADSHKRLKVSTSQYEHLIALGLAKGTRYQVYVGTSPSYGSAHVRAEGRDQVYLASDLSSATMGARVSNWVDTMYLNVTQDDVVAVALENGNGRFEFERGQEGEWTMAGLAAGEVLNQNTVTSLVNRVTSVRMVRPLGQEDQAGYGLAGPGAVLELQVQEEGGAARTVTLFVGARDEEGYVVKSSESPYYVRVAEYTAKDLVEKTRDGFLELPPTPTPEPAS